MLILRYLFHGPLKRSIMLHVYEYVEMFLLWTPPAFRWLDIIWVNNSIPFQMLHMCVFYDINKCLL